MAGKSLDEIWQRMQQESQERRLAELQKEKQLNDIREAQRKEWVRQNKIYESLSNSSSSAAGAGGGTPTQNWITYKDTAWVYPQIDIDNAVNNILNNNLLGPGQGETYSVINFTKLDDFTYEFPTIEDVIYFYSEMFFESALSQPVGNIGYSLAVNTVLSARRHSKIVFRLESGITIVEMTLMTQITSQSDLPSGGDSPDGTIGWASTYLDWNGDGIPDTENDAPPSSWVDNLRFKLY